MTKRLLSVNQLCERLGCSRTTVQGLRKRPDFPRPIHLTGKKLTFVESEIDAWIERLVEEQRQRAVQAGEAACASQAHASPLA